jgi:hypothetical protein
MPEPPDVGLFTRFVLENPWPVALALLLAASWLAWTGLREGLGRRVKVAAGLALVGAAVLVTGLMVDTAGERAETITRALVDAAVQKDSPTAMTLFSTDAVFSAGSPNNPGFGIDFITERFDRLATHYTIESNSMTTLRGYTKSTDEATVHLACLTTVSPFPYPTASRWVIQVQRQPDGSWKITRLTCVSINEQTPSLDQLW